MRRNIPAFVIFIGLLAGGVSTVAQPPAAQPRDEPLAERVDRLDRSLGEIARLLRELVLYRKLDVAFRQVELEERRFAPLDEELSRARDDVRSYERTIAEMKSIAENLQEQIDEAVRAGADPSQVPEEFELRRLRAMIEVEEEQLLAAERRVIELENDLARSRERIAILDEKLQELLETAGH